MTTHEELVLLTQQPIPAARKPLDASIIDMYQTDIPGVLGKLDRMSDDEILIQKILLIAAQNFRISLPSVREINEWVLHLTPEDIGGKRA